MAYINGYMARLVADPELRQTKTGKMTCNFTIANDEGWGDRKRTDFIRCCAWEKTANTVSNHFAKGDNIVVEGRWENHPYQKNEKGYDIPNWQFMVNKIHFLPKQKAKPSEDEDFVPGAEPSIPIVSQIAAVPSYNPNMADQFAVIEDDSDLPF